MRAHSLEMKDRQSTQRKDSEAPQASDETLDNMDVVLAIRSQVATEQITNRGIAPARTIDDDRGAGYLPPTVAIGDTMVSVAGVDLENTRLWRNRRCTFVGCRRNVLFKAIILMHFLIYMQFVGLATETS